MDSLSPAMTSRSRINRSSLASSAACPAHFYLACFTAGKAPGTSFAAAYGMNSEIALVE